MTVNDVRNRYLAFFAARGHAIIPSAPIVPEHDSTTLFTSSGMQPLVPYLLGASHPEGMRLANAQLCFRAEDIDEVGDNRHTTFFEMLGNWSLGDYFKEEQLAWVFEFLTDPEQGLGLNPRKLYVTVFGGDEASGMPADNAAVGIWQKLFTEKGIDAPFVALGTEARGGEIGMQNGRIFAYGAKKNWWSRAGVPQNMPAGELGGPDSEIFYDFGTPHDERFGKECHPNCDCGRFVEIGNSVFMQFVKKEDDTFGELPKRNVDFGGGLERLAAATTGDSDIFMIDVFDAARAVLEERSGVRYRDFVNPSSDDGFTKSELRSFRIILDHMRAAAFMLASGVHPSNTEQGYLLRRLIRRAIREVDKLGIHDAVLAEIAEGFGAAYADVYPFVQVATETIREELQKEEVQFRKTLVSGMRELERMGHNIDAFKLFTTYGFPVELTEEIARERGSELDRESMRAHMKEHREKSRASARQKFAGGLADHATQTVRYHTVHHLLLAALRAVLGPEIHQRGSNITDERVRLDFSYRQKLTDEQKAAVERLVNEKIAEGLPVVRSVMPKDEAEKLGAEHEFGTAYPERVTIYSIGPADATEDNPQFSRAFSIEFCGGPHVENTRVLGQFKIRKEESSSTGVRRIKAVLQ